MQNLRDHIDTLGISQSAFADQLGLSKGYLSQILSGQRAPSRELIQKIDRVTHGEVPPSVWFTTAPLPAHAKHPAE